MISNILNGRLKFTYQRKKLVSLESCYMHLGPYFNLKTSSKVNTFSSTIKQKELQSARDQHSPNLIEQNQIIYAKLMTERMLKG